MENNLPNTTGRVDPLPATNGGLRLQIKPIRVRAIISTSQQLSSMVFGCFVIVENKQDIMLSTLLALLKTTQLGVD